MTSTKSTTTELPDHNGEEVKAAKIKLGGLGTGFAGLDVQPIYMDLDEVGYFVVKAVASESPSAKRDNNGAPYWLNRLAAESWAPVDKDTAERVLQEHAAEVERLKAEIDGQTSIDDELAAKAREDADGTDAPADVAKDAADRVKAGN